MSLELAKFGDASSNSHFQSGYDPQFYDVVSYSHGAFPNGGRDDIRCEQCNRSFSDPIAKLQHLRYSSNHNICCSHDFSTPDDLRYHLINSPDHSYCEKCDEHFQEQGRGQRYWSHITNSPHAHHFCKSCQVELDTSELLNEHLADVHFCCVPCGVHCGTEEKLNVHKQVSGRHWICNQCLREFRGESQLIQHEKIHLEKNITCPRCHMGFCSNSALIIHWENTTACLSSRHLLTQYILQFDTNSNIIPHSSRKSVETYNTHRLKKADETRDWSGDLGGWECRLCRDLFNKFEGLDQHLKSPFHDVPVYRCNGCRSAGNERWFNSLSGLVRHVEDTGCGNGGKGDYARRLMEFLWNSVA